MDLSAAINIYKSGSLPDDLVTLLQMNIVVLNASMRLQDEIDSLNDADVAQIKVISENLKLYDEITDAIVAKTKTMEI